MNLFLDLALVFGGATIVFLLMMIVCALVVGASK